MNRLVILVRILSTGMLALLFSAGLWAKSEITTSLWSRQDVDLPGVASQVVALGPSQLAVLVVPWTPEEENEDAADEEEDGDATVDSAGDEASEETVLVEDDPEDEIEAEVWWIDLRASPVRKKLLLEGVDLGARLEQFDLNADGQDQLVLLQDDEVVDFGSAATLSTRLARGEAPRQIAVDGFGPLGVPPYVRGEEARVGLVFAEAGELVQWSTGDPLSDGDRHPLPILAEHTPWGLLLSSPKLTMIPDIESGASAFVVGPRVHGGRRLQSTYTGTDGESFDSWALLAVGEDLRSSEYVQIDGRLFLMVTTAKRGGLLAKLRLSLFPVRSDRSRSGMPPTHRWELDCYNWFSPKVLFDDIDGDGKQDLTVAHLEGLGGGDLVLLQSLGRGGGRFFPRVERRKVSFDEGDWKFSEDVNGDGIADVVRITRQVEVFFGQPGRKLLSKSPVAISKPLNELGEKVIVVNISTEGTNNEVDSFSVTGQELYLTDVDGDLVTDVVVSGPREGGGYLAVLRSP